MSWRNGQAYTQDLRDRVLAMPGVLREVAERFGVSQAYVCRARARREKLGQTSPGAGTLARLLAATGFETRTELAPLSTPQSHMLDDVARILRLTPEARLRELANVGRFVAAARRV